MERAASKLAEKRHDSYQGIALAMPRVAHYQTRLQALRLLEKTLFRSLFSRVIKMQR